MPPRDTGESDDAHADDPVPPVALTPVAYFPEKYFLENLAVRSDGSVLGTAVLQKELWCVPGPGPSTGASPVLVHTFGHLITGIVEIEPAVFIVSLSDGYTTHESYLARVDLTGWTPGEVLSPQLIFAYVTRHRASTIANCGREPEAGRLANAWLPGLRREILARWNTWLGGSPRYRGWWLSLSAGRGRRTRPWKTPTGTSACTTGAASTGLTSPRSAGRARSSPPATGAGSSMAGPG